MPNQNSKLAQTRKRIKLKIEILGSGTSTGVPSIGCHCPVCLSTETRNQRLRSSILITRQDTSKNIVIDTTPDFRTQMLRSRSEALEHVLYTHTHADHCHGFDDLRVFYFHSKKPVDCWIHHVHAKEFRTRFFYAFEETLYPGTKPKVVLHEIDDQIFVIDGLPVQPYLLPHGKEFSTAYRIGSFVYATDFKSIPDKILESWKGTVKTMIASGVGFGQYPTHSSVDETVAVFQKLEVDFGVITHLSHEVDSIRDSSKLPEGIQFAYDGMQIEVEL